MSEIYEIDEIVTLKKNHPCGSNQWKIVRLGAEIGLECLGCHHRILLSRRDLHQKIKQKTSRKAGIDDQKVSL